MLSGVSLVILDITHVVPPTMPRLPLYVKNTLLRVAVVPGRPRCLDFCRGCCRCIMTVSSRLISNNLLLRRNQQQQITDQRVEW